MADTRKASPYDLDIERARQYIDEQRPQRVCLQFPDGLKPYAQTVHDALQNTFPEITFFIYLGSCFGGCDLPQLSSKNIDLLIQWGHNEYLV